MIKPHPESDLTLNIMILGAEILTALKKEKSIFTEKLLLQFLKEDDRRTPEMFLNAVLFLYSVGMLDQEAYRLRLQEVENTANAS